MANYLCIFSASDEHINFMAKYPGSVAAYYAGESPQFSDLEIDPPSFIDKILGRSPGITQSSMQNEMPSDWPREEPPVFGPEVNHRNVDLYHRILNNTSDPVVGSGSLFQTWLHQSHSAVFLDRDIGENFAFKNHQLGKLLELVNAVTVESLQSQFTAWCDDVGKSHAPQREECSELLKDFRTLIPGLTEATNSGRGIVWVTS